MESIRLKLFKLKYEEDYGHNFYVTLIQIKRWCLVQSCFCTAVYGKGFPYLNLTLGGGRLIAVNFDFWKIGMCVELFSRSWFY